MSNVPSQTRFPCFGSRISAAHRPHGRCLTPRNLFRRRSTAADGGSCGFFGLLLLLFVFFCCCEEEEETEQKVVEEELEEGEEDDEGEGDEEVEYDEGRCMVIWVISLFSFFGLVVVLFFSLSSSLDESESVASWSVRMIRTTLCLVLRLVLHGGSPSKFELGAESFSFSSFSVDCTGMSERENREKNEGLVRVVRFLFVLRLFEGSVGL